MKKVLLVFGLFVSIAISPVVNAEEQVLNSEVNSTVVEESTSNTDVTPNATEENSAVSDTTTSTTEVVDNTINSAEEVVEESNEEENTIGTRAALKYDNIYRLYNPNSGAHHYTKLTTERDNLKRAGWRYEGIAWYAPQRLAKKVYRAYNPNSGEHLWTIKYDEVKNVVRAGWRDEGVAFLAGDSRSAIHHLPVYRLFNPNSRSAGSHHYTKNWQEAANLIGAGWRDEGTAFYVK